MTYAPAYPHDPITEIMPDVFMVRGSIKMNPLMRITRNMVVVRHAGELTLINSMRLDEAGEQQLKSLGKVSRVLRTGCFHGLDDPYYKTHYDAELWTTGQSRAYPEPQADRVLQESDALPFPDADLFCFQHTKQPEAAVLLQREGGLLLTCDALQHYGDYKHNTWLARRIMPRIGFPKTTLVGPLWLKGMMQNAQLMEADFRRLLQWEFENFLAAHGSLLKGGAHAAVTRAVDRAFAVE